MKPWLTRSLQLILGAFGTPSIRLLAFSSPVGASGELTLMSVFSRVDHGVAVMRAMRSSIHLFSRGLL